MPLNYFYTLWGHIGAADLAIENALKAGFDGIEGQVPNNSQAYKNFKQSLVDSHCLYIAEVATTGQFIPDRRLTPKDHLAHLAAQLDVLAPLNPLFVTCLAGCDAWPVNLAIAFFNQAMDLAEERNLIISFETHRGRCLFNPWVTETIVQALPNIKLTFDISHWCVVCEGLQPTEEALIKRLANNAHHIHARVGYNQGAQVPQPFAGAYQTDFELHVRNWKTLIGADNQLTTITPEFGPDGYQYRDLLGENSLVDIKEINRSMMMILREELLKPSEVQTLSFHEQE